MLGNPNVTVDANVFEPGLYSVPDLHFLLENIKDPPIVALDKPLPRGVSKVRMEVTLGRVSELEMLRERRGEAWGFLPGDPETTGYDAIIDSITRYLAWHDRCAEIKRRGGPAHPSMWQWDDTGHAAKYAIGSDSGELVRTEILPDGSRRPFAVRLKMTSQDVLSSTLSDVMPWVKSANSEEIRKDELVLTTSDKIGKYTCTVCTHAEEFQTASQQSKAMARGRMMRHLKSSKVEPNRHRILWSRSSRTGK